ncbi:MAG: hypothetical protein QNK26_16645 [Moritella sp.]|uniref:hypothetical protein n=1 Tax=Moritella sp. TaxID=78556 RepID=UPI0029ACBE1B|nr:hypothetical protein [Moritella sp.]MDX2322216.1 hypothetical protein [Moritella sp.]
MINLAKIKKHSISHYCHNHGLASAISKVERSPNKSFITLIHQFCVVLTAQCRNLFIISFMIVSSPVHAEGVEDDKQKHFIAETVICGATMMYTESWWQTMLVGFTIGALKETYDASQEGNEFDKNDMAANMLGCFAGVTYGATVLHFSYESDTDTAIIGIEGKF